MGFFPSNVTYVGTRHWLLLLYLNKQFVLHPMGWPPLDFLLPTHPLIRVNPGVYFRVGADFHFGGLVKFYKKI
jgi:hypothetical protein